MSLVSYKIMRPSGTPADTHATLATGLTGDLQPSSGGLQRLAQGGETTDRYYRLFCNAYTSGVTAGDVVVTIDADGVQVNKYDIIEIDDWPDERQLDFMLRLLE